MSTTKPFIQPLAPEDMTAELGRLAAENTLFRVAIEQLPVGLSMFDKNDILILSNHRYCEIWGLPESIVRPSITFKEILGVTNGSETPTSAAQRPLPLGETGVRRREWLLEDGRTIEVVVTRMPDGSCVALHKDITEQKLSANKIAYMAHHDVLTGLSNRVALNEKLEALLTRCSAENPLLIMCLDLDDFKSVNDTFGHAVGDEVLRQAASRIKQCSRAEDMVVRFGGDEFAIIQHNATQPSASSALAKRIIDALGEPFVVSDHLTKIGVSIGIAISPQDGTTADELMKRADIALYCAKAMGRGAYKYFEPAMAQGKNINRRKLSEF